MIVVKCQIGYCSWWRKRKFLSLEKAGGSIFFLLNSVTFSFISNAIFFLGIEFLKTPPPYKHQLLSKQTKAAKM